MRYEAIRHVTPGRRRWLEALVREGIADRPRGRVGRDCMVFGWTDWACVMHDSGIVRAFRDGRAMWNKHTIVGEMITEEGREALTRAASGR